MMDLIIRRLGQWGTMSMEDRLMVASLRSHRARRLPPRDTITTDEKRGKVSFILRGWVCQYGHLHDGRRQILNLLLPGDFSIFRPPTPNEIEPALHTLTETLLLEIPLERFEGLCAASPRLAALFKRAENVQIATSREWVLSLGARKAKERCAHLICEIIWRLRSIDMVIDGWFEFPLTQDELGYAIGATTVTVNKVLQELRHDNLIEQHGRRMRVIDLRRIECLALFDPTFLFLRSWKPADDVPQRSPLRPSMADARRA